MKKIFALAAAALLLASCQEAAAPQSLAPIHFGGKPPMRFNVAQINVVETYRSPMQVPNIEHTLLPTPTQAVQQWAAQRLQAAGTRGNLEITIEDASVKEVALPKKKGVEGFFTDDQSERYDARIRATMRLYDGANVMSMADASVEVTKSRSVNEKATVAEREKMFHDMTQEMMTQFDAEAEARLRQYFGNYFTY